jgi:hypothetical protein
MLHAPRFAGAFLAARAPFRIFRHGMVSSAQLEVEQKFAILGRNMDELQGQIRQAGFELDASIQMVDWYFDAKGSSVLAVRDH